MTADPLEETFIVDDELEAEAGFVAGPEELLRGWWVMGDDRREEDLDRCLLIGVPNGSNGFLLLLGNIQHRQTGRPAV